MKQVWIDLGTTNPHIDRRMFQTKPAVAKVHEVHVLDFGAQAMSSTPNLQ